MASKKRSASNETKSSYPKHLKTVSVEQEVCGHTSKYFPAPGGRLTRDFFNRGCLELCRALLGQVLVRQLAGGEVVRGKIVETEAYPGRQDGASHSYQGKRTARNGAMFLDPGTAYVYNIYGIYCCFNISSREDGGCVLLRALEPLEGMEQMRRRRSVRRKDGGDKLKATDLCSGPSKLCQAMEITKKLDQVDLCDSEVMWVEKGDEAEQGQIVVTTRIGIESSGTESAGKPYRFYKMGNTHVSVRDRLNERNCQQE